MSTIKGRSLGLSLSGARSVCEAETAVPTGDAGVECSDLDQLTLVVSGDQSSSAHLRIYRRFADFSGYDLWVPGELVAAMATKEHDASVPRTAGLVVVQTLGADRVHAVAEVVPSGIDMLYMKWYALTKIGEPFKPLSGCQVATSNFAPLHIAQGHTDFEPVDGEGQTVAFTDSQARSTVLTVGAKYHMWADQDCYIVVGGSGISATSSDYRLNKNRVIEFIPKTSTNYVSALRISTSGNLYVSKANTYADEACPEG